MNEITKKKLLKGLDEYYAKRKDLLSETTTPRKTVKINELTYTQVDCTAEEWIESVGGIKIDDIQWQM
jgi:hypothetical protein